jgi:two-component system sensor histidine kinase YesM
MDIIKSTVRIIGSRQEILTALTSNNKTPSGQGDFSMNVYLQSIQQLQPFWGNITFIGTGGQFFSSNIAFKRAEFEELYKQNTKNFYSGMYEYYFVDTHESDLLTSGSKDVLTGVWPIYDIKTEKLIGQVYLGLNYSIFQEMFVLSPTINNEKILIIDPTGKIVYNHPTFISFDSVLKEYPQLITAEKSIIEGTAFGTNSFIISDTSRIVGWRFIRIIENKYITVDTQRTRQYFNIVFIISIITSVVFSIFLSQILTKPVKLLFEACKRIESGDLSFRVSINSKDEMGQLGHTFNLVMDQINMNLERELVVQKRQNELKLKVLLSQINPHFLYNTLDSIKFLANFQEIHNIASMCSSLINLLKYNLFSSSLASLGEEVDSIRNYVEIQKFRYGDIFELKTEIASGTEHCIISRFVLQPLVENCIIHGFDNIENGGEVIIRSGIEKEILCLEVINNGNEINDETLSKINRGIIEEDNINGTI